MKFHFSRSKNKTLQKQHGKLKNAMMALHEVTQLLYANFDKIEEENEIGILREQIGALVTCHYHYHQASALEFEQLHAKIPGSAEGK